MAQGDGAAPERSAPEHRLPEAPAAGTRFSAAEIHDNVMQTANEELVRPAAALFWSSLAAGLTIGWSFVLGAFLASRVPAAYEHVATAVAYPTGFIFVIIARSQLFTENTLEPVIPALSRHDRQTLWRMLRLWGIVLAGNLIGAFVFAMLLARTPVVDGTVRGTMRALSTTMLTASFAKTFYAAIFAGWLIALTAWLVEATQSTLAQIVLIWLTTAPISALDFRHSIAGSVEAMFAAASGTATWSHTLGGFVVPAVLGNIVGGVLFVALINHGQVSADHRARSQLPDSAEVT